MTTEAQKFIKSNQLKINNKLSTKKILIADRSIPEHVVLHSLCGYIFNKYCKFNVEVLTNLSSENELIKIYKSFNINKFHILQIKFKFLNLFIFCKSIFTFIFSILKIKLYGETWFIKKFSLKKIYMGDLVYDNYIRFGHSYLNKSFFDKKFLKLLFILIYQFYFIDKLLNKNKYQAVISGTHTYVSVSAISMRLALKKNIKVINIISNNLRIFKNYNASLRSELYMSKEIVKNLSRDKFWIRKYSIYFQNRLKGKILYPTAKNAYKNKIDLKKKDIIKIFKNKNINRLGVFAPHAFSDANHASGRFIFRDYFDQFKETIKILKNDKNTLWLVKPHPSRHYYNEQGIVEREIKKLNSQNIVLCPENITPKSVIIASDLFVTGRGTIGLEAACFGKKPILAGETFYSHLGFTKNAKNLHHYKNLLNSKKQLLLTNKEIKIAQKAFYFMAFKNSSIKSQIFPITNFIDINVTKKSIIQQKIKVGDYLYNLNIRLKGKKIYQDNLYKNFKLKILTEFKKKK